MKYIALLLLISLTSCAVSPERAEAIRVGISTLGPILERRGLLSADDLQDIKDGAAVLIVAKEDTEEMPAVEVTASK